MTQQFDPPPSPYEQKLQLAAAPVRAGRKLAWLWALGIVIAFGSGLAIGLAADRGQSAPAADRGKSLVAASTATPATTFEPVTVTAEPAKMPPSTGDFAVSVKVLSKHCFGSAGCNITYRIDPSYRGPALDSGETYTITYEVTGVEDGPQINSFTMTGDQAQYESEELAQTPSSNVKLKAKVTGVVEG
jgi:hypothetical protein